MRKQPHKAVRLALGIATLGSVGLIGAFGAGTAYAAGTRKDLRTSLAGLRAAYVARPVRSPQWR
jgi:hypothetical protein